MHFLAGFLNVGNRKFELASRGHQNKEQFKVQKLHIMDGLIGMISSYIFTPNGRVGQEQVEVVEVLEGDQR